MPYCDNRYRVSPYGACIRCPIFYHQDRDDSTKCTQDSCENKRMFLDENGYCSNTCPDYQQQAVSKTMCEDAPKCESFTKYMDKYTSCISCRLYTHQDPDNHKRCT